MITNTIQVKTENFIRKLKSSKYSTRYATCNLSSIFQSYFNDNNMKQNS